MSAPDAWPDLARKLDWEFSYVDEKEVFPEATSGTPWLEHDAWADWDEPYRTSYADYVRLQHEKEQSVEAVRALLGNAASRKELDAGWTNAVKLHAACLPLAEFAATLANLRAARFGRDSAWRSMATLGALDECRHTQIPLLLMHELVSTDRQFDWTHRFYHTNNWVSIAARSLFDEMILTADPIEHAVATHFVFETGFTNLQFVGLADSARRVGDRMFEKMITSIQTDEARHAQIGPAVLAVVAKHDPKRAQYLLDKWFWRSWLLFGVITGFTLDYLTPLRRRVGSFKEFMEEWILEQFLDSVGEYGLERPWYWDVFLESLDHYHHMVYASAYCYRSTVWFDMVVPGPDERVWLHRKYPASWQAFDPVWERIKACWQETDPGVDFAVHGTAIPTFCDLCQLVLSNGTPDRNTATTLVHEGRKYIFCSEPCRWIFESEPARYRGHLDVVKRVLAGQAPGNLLELLTRYSGLEYEVWGKDAYRGDYPWLARNGRRTSPS